MLRSKRRDERNTQRGSVLAVSAFGMLAFLLAVGLCVDISHFYVVKAELQNAADASALAGASALNSSPGGITEATSRAVAVMNNYEFNNTGVTITADHVKFAVNFDGPYVSAADAQAVAANVRFVSVEVPPKSVGVFFSTPALGRNTVDLSQKAVAGMSVPPNVFCEWIPLSVIDDDTHPMLPGQTYVIRGGPQNQVLPGNRQILAINGTGANMVKWNLAHGINDCAEPGSVYTKDTKPGVDSGPVRDGLNTRFDDYAGGRPRHPAARAPGPLQGTPPKRGSDENRHPAILKRQPFLARPPLRALGARHAARRAGDSAARAARPLRRDRRVRSLLLHLP